MQKIVKNGVNLGYQLNVRPTNNGTDVFSQCCKRILDITSTSIGLVVLSPLIALVALLIRRDSPGPVLYRQIRIGRHGRPFQCLKFRTMLIDSDQHGSITTSTDCRITRVGHVLRRYKLDELPQLWQVLTGDMSLVGPRPDVPGYADLLAGEARRILDVRPGITGPATLAFRNEGELLRKSSDPAYYNDQVVYPEKTRINLEYVNNWSFWKDIGYILITVFPPLDRWLKLVPKLDQSVVGEYPILFPLQLGPNPYAKDRAGHQDS